ncbi:hypothetical protein [Streptomyces hainanensis]|uniref:Lipoprotein n=1 Tax=Streptomyces hainanensis TaxID=402648 RepID=A0A4R4SUI7_9ACTN|nr:hypothetical protein [Streptomyces hainanensis]TDC67820.1 hypothetical protein E1283_28270 [Streptomyces hainanensis]
MSARRAPVGSATIGGMVLAVAALAGCSTGPADPTSRGVPAWRTDATPAGVGERLGVPIPPSATDRRAAHQDGFQDDVLLLVFTLPTAELTTFLPALAPEFELHQRREPLVQSLTPMAPFAHLDVPEPETLGDVREGQVCAPCEDQLDYLEIAVHPLDDQDSRVYLRGVD